MHTSHLYVSQNMACGSLLADNSTATLEHAERTHSVSARRCSASKAPGKQCSSKHAHTQAHATCQTRLRNLLSKACTVSMCNSMAGARQGVSQDLHATT